MWKGLTDSKKTKRLSKEEIKKQLLESMIIDENLEFDDLNNEAEEIQDPEKAAEKLNGMKISLKRKRKGL